METDRASLLGKAPSRAWEFAGTSFTTLSTAITFGYTAYTIWRDPSSATKMIPLFVSFAFGAIGFGCGVKSLRTRQVVVEQPNNAELNTRLALIAEAAKEDKELPNINFLDREAHDHWTNIQRHLLQQKNTHLFLNSLDTTLKKTDRRITLTQSMEQVLLHEVPHTKSIANEIDRLFNQVAAEANRAGQMQQQVEKLQKELGEKTNERDQLNMKAEQQQQEIENLSAQLKQRNDEFNDLSKLASAQIVENSTLKQKLEADITELEEIQKQTSKLKSTLEEQKQQYEKTQNNKLETDRANQDLKKQIQEKTQAFDQLTETLKQREQEIVNLKKSIETETQKLNQLKSESDQKQIEIEQLRKDSALHKTNSEVLKLLVQNMTDALNQVEAKPTFLPQGQTSFADLDQKAVAAVKQRLAEAATLRQTIDKTTQLLVKLINKIDPEYEFQDFGTDSVQNLKDAWNVFKEVWLEQQTSLNKVLEANSVSIFNELADLQDTLSQSIPNIAVMKPNPTPKDFVTSSKYLDPVILQNLIDTLNIILKLQPAVSVANMASMRIADDNLSTTSSTNSSTFTSPIKKSQRTTQAVDRLRRVKFEANIPPVTEGGWFKFSMPSFLSNQVASPVSENGNTPVPSPVKPPIQTIEPDDFD